MVDDRPTDRPESLGIDDHNSGPDELVDQPPPPAPQSAAPFGVSDALELPPSTATPGESSSSSWSSPLLAVSAAVAAVASSIGGVAAAIQLADTSEGLYAGVLGVCAIGLCVGVYVAIARRSVETSLILPNRPSPHTYSDWRYARAARLFAVLGALLFGMVAVVVTVMRIG